MFRLQCVPGDLFLPYEHKIYPGNMITMHKGGIKYFGMNSSQIVVLDKWLEQAGPGRSGQLWHTWDPSWRYVDHQNQVVCYNHLLIKEDYVLGYDECIPKDISRFVFVFEAIALYSHLISMHIDTLHKCRGNDTFAGGFAISCRVYGEQSKWPFVKSGQYGPLQGLRQICRPHTPHAIRGYSTH